MGNGYWKYIYCFHICRFYVPIQREPEINEKKEISNPTVSCIAEKLYENNVKDYIITANIHPLLGLSHAVKILCEVRSNYTNLPFISSRYADLKFLYDNSLNDPETIQMKGGMMEDMPVTKMLATSEDSRYFLFTYITIERPVYEARRSRYLSNLHYSLSSSTT
jgi:hypothetical protein